MPLPFSLGGADSFPLSLTSCALFLPYNGPGWGHLSHWHISSFCVENVCLLNPVYCGSKHYELWSDWSGSILFAVSTVAFDNWLEIWHSYSLFIAFIKAHCTFEWYFNVLHQLSHNAQSAHTCCCNNAVIVWLCVCTRDNPLAEARG